MGCKSSKNVQQPGQGRPSPQRNKGSQRSPQKSPSKSIKQIKQAELEKHKESDIVQFVKLGKIEMVKGLIDHCHLGLKAMYLRGEGPQLEDQKQAEEWNPLLIAIAHKKIEIVKYLLNDLNVSLKLFGSKPLKSEQLTDEEFILNSIFSLKLAVQNKDLDMLKELWNYFENWSYLQLKSIIQVIIQEKWASGLQILKHLTTQIIFKSLSLDDQMGMVEFLLKERKKEEVEVKKQIDECLQNSPYSLITLYILMDRQQAEYMNQQEFKVFVQKSHSNISQFEFFPFKYSLYYQILQDKIQSFEQKGEAESAILKKLKEHLQKIDQPNEHVYFQSQKAFDKMNEDLNDIFIKCEQNRLKQLIELTELRRLGYHEGRNQHLNQDLNQENLWTHVHSMVYEGARDDAISQMIQVLPEMGIHLKYAIEQSKEDGDDKLKRDIELQAAIFFMAFERNRFETIKTMWTQQFVNIWEPEILPIIIDLIKKFNQEKNLLKTFLNSPVGQNLIFHLQWMKDQDDVVTILFNKFQDDQDTIKEIKQVMSQQMYASMLLFKEIERNNFMKLKDYRVYEQCIQNITHSELEQMSKQQDKQEKILAFLRYISLLEEKDEKKLQGQKLLSKIYEIEQFKPFASNQSLQILEFESRIYEEEGIEEAVGKIQMHHVDAHNKVSMKELDFKKLIEAMEMGDSRGAIHFLKSYKISDLLFIRGQEGQFQNVVQKVNNQFKFQNVEKNRLNLIQLAVCYHMIDVIKYVLECHQIYTTAQQIKTVDPRIILLSDVYQEDQSFTLKLAIQEQDIEILMYLWNNYYNLYSHQHLLDLIEFMISYQTFEFIKPFLDSEATQTIFSRSTNEQKKFFLQTLDDNQLNQCQDPQTKLQILRRLQQEPYNRFDDDIPEDIQQKLFELIKDNEVDHLQHLLEEQQFRSIQKIQFEFMQDQEEVIKLNDGQVINVFQLNPVCLAIYKKSLSCLKVLVEKYGLKQSNLEHQISVQINEDIQLPFSNLILPLLILTKDNDILSYVLRNQGFYFKKQDMLSFVQGALLYRWNIGIKTFLQSPISVLVYLNFDDQDERQFVQNVIKQITEIQDAKFRMQSVTSIIRETLARKPYSKQLTHLILNNMLADLDMSETLLQETRKHLTQEDFMQMSICNQEIMHELEKKYGQQDFDPISDLEREIVLIVQRYMREGKQDKHFQVMDNQI